MRDLFLKEPCAAIDTNCDELGRALLENGFWFLRLDHVPGVDDIDLKCRMQTCSSSKGPKMYSPCECRGFSRRSLLIRLDSSGRRLQRLVLLLTVFDFSGILEMR